jgi:hypothetical protein
LVHSREDIVVGSLIMSKNQLNLESTTNSSQYWASGIIKNWKNNAIKPQLVDFFITGIKTTQSCKLSPLSKTIQFDEKTGKITVIFNTIKISMFSSIQINYIVVINIPFAIQTSTK